MRYVILHTPRTGSNVLCDALVSTGIAGMVSLDTAGFFIGFGEAVKEAWENGAVDQYFEANQTDNGIQGCKLGWDYIEHLNKVLPFGVVDDILKSFDRYILLTREDKVAQAVSRLIARSTGEWTSEDHKKPRQQVLEPKYDESRIAYFIAQHAGHEAAIDTWLNEHQCMVYPMTYEVNALSWHSAIADVLQWIDAAGWDGSYTITLQKQHDPRKADWIERYRNRERVAERI